MSGIKNIASNDTLPEIVPVILAGGQGMRLRPLTGEARPKPFLRLLSGYSMLQITAMRAAGFAPPVVVCHHEQALRAQEELQEGGIRPGAVIGEPGYCGTAAAIAAAALALKDKGGVMAILPSDHYIGDARIFRETLRRGATEVTGDNLVMLGVRPARPDTRYGYIRASQGKVEGFIEKPAARTARKLFKDPDCFWNTGIFLIKPAFFLSLLEEYEPLIHEAVSRACRRASQGGPFFRPDPHDYINSPSISVDYAVMERCQNAKFLCLDTEWHDMGCWSALLSVKLKAAHGKLTRRQSDGFPDFKAKPAKF